MKSKKLSEEEISKHLNNVGKYIGEKIACLNRAPRGQQSNRKRKKKKSGTPKSNKSKERIESEDDSTDGEVKIDNENMSIDVPGAEEVENDSTDSLNSAYSKSPAPSEKEFNSDKEFENDVSR